MRRWLAVIAVTTMALLQGCGYSVRMVALEEEERELQEKKNLEGVVARLQLDVKKLRKQSRDAVVLLQGNFKQSRKKVIGLQKGQADLNVRMDAAAITLRTVQGDIEEKDRQLSGLFRQIENVAFRVNEHGETKAKLSQQGRKHEKLLQTQLKRLESLKRRLDEQQKEVDSVQNLLEKQADMIKLIDSNLRNVSKAQEKSLQGVSDQASELAEKIPPTLNRHSVRLDEVEWQVKKINNAIDVKKINKNMADFSGALETLKKTLDILGTRMTTKIDQQGQLIRATTKKVKGIESRLALGEPPASIP